MRSWSDVEVPQLPGAGRSPLVFDTVTGVRVLACENTHRARLYACGITPYDATHLGHAFTYVSVDLLNRAWRDAGLQVEYAQNVTDVDDPLLERADDTNVNWRDLADEQIELFRSDMEALRVLPPDAYRGVEESLDLIVARIQDLIAAGAAYQLDDEYPDWYYSVAADPAFLPGRDLAADEAVFAEHGGDPDRPGKRHRLDPLLWRMERPGEPAWDTPIGRGRPGWHIECAAIALDALGPRFDVQAGGVDLAFPHHPMCASQAKVLTGELFANAFVHVGMVALDGEKMSKSRGNLVFVHRLLAAGVDPMAIRLVLLAHHYRDDWEYTTACLDEANDRLAAWRAAVTCPGPAAAPVVEAIREALADNLDAPAALAAIDAWAAANGTDAAAGTEVARAVDALLGIAL